MPGAAPSGLLIGGCRVARLGPAVIWEGGLAIDADGAPNCYAPIASGLAPLDHLGNAGSCGKWWGLVCNSEGVPLVQGPGDPCPGYYIAPTALTDKRYGRTDPRRYVNASVVPYIVMPPELKALGVGLGDVAQVAYGGKAAAAIVADIGPHGRIGEGSPALAALLGIPPSARNGGCSSGVMYRVFPGSAIGWPAPQASIEARVAGMMQAWKTT